MGHQLGATAYVNPEAGLHLFDVSAFAAKGIQLYGYRAPDLTYSQRRKFPFESNLSIIDVMMFVSPETIRAAIAQPDFIPA